MTNEIKTRATTISGGVFKNEVGFFWVLRVTFEGKDFFYEVNGADHGDYFATEEAAKEHAIFAGRDLANYLVEQIHSHVPACNVDIIDRQQMH